MKRSRRSGRRGAIVGLALAAAAPLAAQEAAPSVTLEEAIELAVRHAPQVVQAGGAVRRAESAERSALGSYLPSISVSSGASLASTERFNPQTNTSVTGSSDSYNAGLNASLELFSGGRRGAELRRTRAETDAAEAALVEQRFAVALAAKRAFYDGLRADELIRVAEARGERARQGLEAARQRLAVGSGTRSDVLRSELELNSALQALLEAQSQKRTTAFALGRLVGADGPVQPRAEQPAELRPLALSREEIATLVLERSPAVRAALASARAADAGVRAARSQYLPSLQVSSGYDLFNQEPAFSDARGSWSVRLGLSYPVFNRFQREDAVARAGIQAEVTRAQLDDERRAARAELERVLAALELAERRVELTEEAVAVAEEDLRVQQERYRLGASTIIELVTSQGNLVQAENDRVAARYDYQIARAELEALAGREL